MSILLPLLVILGFAAVVYYDRENVIALSAALETMAENLKQGSGVSDAIEIFYELLQERKAA